MRARVVGQQLLPPSLSSRALLNESLKNEVQKGGKLLLSMAFLKLSYEEGCSLLEIQHIVSS